MELGSYTVASPYSVGAADYQAGINFGRMRAERLARTRAALKRHGIGAALFVRHENIRYTLAVKGHAFAPQLSYALIFAEVSYYLVVAGLIGGAVAAPFGFIDWSAIPRNTRAKRIGAMHGGGNAIVLVLFLVSAVLRNDLPSAPPAVAYVCSFVGAGLALVTAWLGGELVDRLGIGVSEGAHVDAPSSLRQRTLRHRTT